MSNFDARSYTITVKRVLTDGERCFYAKVAEIPDISAYSESWCDAYENVIEALELLHEDAIEQGKPFPVPFNNNDIASYSGRVTLRMSRSMHANIARCAEEDGVSLNQWVIEALAQRCGQQLLHRGRNWNKREPSKYAITQQHTDSFVSDC